MPQMKIFFASYFVQCKNDTISPKLDLKERLADILEVDAADLIKASDDSGRSRARYKTKEEKQQEAFEKLISYYKYFRGMIDMPISLRKDLVAIGIRRIERHICYSEFIYQYDRGGRSLRQEFYSRVADAFSHDAKHYVEYMEHYFGDKPQ